MMRVFVYEYVSGGGYGRAPVDEALRTQGVAMRDALVADLSRAEGISVAYAEAAAGGGAPPGDVPAEALRPNAGERAVDFVRRQGRTHDRVWAIAPESERALETLHHAVGAARWIGCDAPAIRLASSKQATLARLAERGVRTPLAFMQRTPEQSGVRRWVVKPDDGAGSSDMRVHELHGGAKADWTQRLRKGRAAVIEPWVEGEALSLSLLCHGAQTELVSVNRQHIDVDENGTVRFGGVTPNAVPPTDARTPALRTVAAQIGRAIPGLGAFVGVDLVWHEQHGPVVIEVNPRLTSAYVGLCTSLQRNLAAEIVARHRPRNPPHDPAS